MFHSLASQIAFVALFATCGFAFAKGSYVERWAAGFICLSWSLSAAISAIWNGLFPADIQELTFLAVDAATAIGLLILAMRFAKVWLGVAMLMQSVELALHGAAMADWGIKFNLYMLMNNIVSFSLLLLLAGATATAWSQRAQGKQGKTPRPPSGSLELPI